MNNLKIAQPKVVLIRYTPAPEKVVATAARLCYSAMGIDELRESVEGTDQDDFINTIISLGHQSVLEHVSYTFLIEGISRATTHQLVRHRVASYSQRSQRYVREEGEFRHIIPPCLRQDPQKFNQFEDLMARIYDIYSQWIDAGIPPEDARYILPNAAETKITVTMNARELRHFFRYRCCQRAQWEIRALALLMLWRVYRVSPNLFKNSGPACITDPCPEGRMSCGLSSKVKQAFSHLSTLTENDLLEHFNCPPYT